MDRLKFERGLSRIQDRCVAALSRPGRSVFTVGTNRRIVLVRGAVMCPLYWSRERNATFVLDGAISRQRRLPNAYEVRIVNP